MCRWWRGACAGLVVGLVVTSVGCASRARTIEASDPQALKRAATLTAREWGYRYERETQAGIVFRAGQPMRYVAGNEPEELAVLTKPASDGQVRVTVHFSGPTAGTEQYFLGDLEHNLQKVQAEPQPAEAEPVLAGRRE